MGLISPERNCPDCKNIISFEEFLMNHPQYSLERALLIWNDKLLTIFCPQCFFNAPEKPYKKKRYRYSQSYTGNKNIFHH